MGESKHDGLAIPGRVVLAYEPPFALGPLIVDPPTRQIIHNGRSETLEPRVMQVLIPLARADGAIVTRDELIERCWDGRIVTDDAVNRILSRLRRVASGVGSGSFTVETIPRVGYRLVLTGAPQSGGELPKTMQQWPEGTLERRTVLAGIGALVLTGGVLAYSGLRRGRDDQIPAEAMELFERADTLKLAQTAATTGMIIPYLEESVRIAPKFGAAWGALALQYRSEMERTPGRRTELKVRLQEAVTKARRYSPGNPDAEAAIILPSQYFGQWSKAEPVFRRMAARHPKYALGHSGLGLFLMNVGRWNEAIDALTRSRQLQPLSVVTAYTLIVSLWSAGRISEAERELEFALRRWPRHSAIWQTNVKLLTLTGRPEAALKVLGEVLRLPTDLDHAGFKAQMQLLAQALSSGGTSDRSAAVSGLQRLGDPNSAAMYIAALGEVALALDILEGVYLGVGAWGASEQKNPTTHPLFQPHASPLWNEQRFYSLLDRIGLVNYWRVSGSRPDYRRRT